MIKTGITGCTGRVGSLLVQELQSGLYPDMTLAGGTVRQAGDMPYDFFVTNDPVVLFEKSDVIIDFTTPAASRNHAHIAHTTGTPIVVATSGLSRDDENMLNDLAIDIPIVYAPNTSVIVTVMNALTEQAAKILGPEYDIEIVEGHHKHKIDAPSGTAIMLGKTAAKARGIDFEDNAVFARSGETGARPDNAIGFATVRGGDLVGEHRVGFYGTGERLEISNQSTDRKLYARGALQAAEWLVKQKPGLYGMADVLGITS